jgi:hypothetical protein
MLSILSIYHVCFWQTLCQWKQLLQPQTNWIPTADANILSYVVLLFNTCQLFVAVQLSLTLILIPKSDLIVELYVVK